MFALITRCQTYIGAFRLLAFNYLLEEGGDYMKALVICPLGDHAVPPNELITTQDVDKSKVFAKGTYTRDFLQSVSYCCKDCFEEYFASEIRE